MLFSGHYLPAIADVLHQANKAGEFTDLNLKGVLMGNPWTSPLDIELSYLPFAKAHGLISQVRIDTAHTRTRQLSLYCILAEKAWYVVVQPKMPLPQDKTWFQNSLIPTFVNHV